MKAKHLLLLLVVFSLHFTSFSQGNKAVQTVIPVKKVNKEVLISFADENYLYGFKDSVTQRIVIPANYSSAYYFIDELALVSKMDTSAGVEKFGFINKTGKIVVPLKYDGADQFDQGLSKVRLGGEYDSDIDNYVGGKYGLVDKTGKEVVKVHYDAVSKFSEGLALVGIIDTAAKIIKYGYINKLGFEVIKPKYQEAYNFDKGLAIVVFENKTGIIDKTGKVVVSPKYDNIDGFNDVMYLVTLNEKKGLIDRLGKVVVDTLYNEIDPFNNGLAAVQKDNKYGYIDITGKVIIPLKYNYAFDFGKDHPGFGSVELDVDLQKEYFWVNKTGDQFESVSLLTDGMARIQSGNKYGFANKNGTVVVPLKYDFVKEFKNGYAAVFLNKKIGFIDNTGKEIVAPTYDWFSGIEDGYGSFQLNGKYGFVDKTGKEIVPPTYDEVYVASKGLAPVKLNNQFGYVDVSGKIIIPIKYEYAGSFAGDTTYVNIGRTYDNFKNPVIKGKWGLIDRTGKEIIPIKYDNIYGKAGGLTYIVLDSLVGLFDVKKGIEVLAPKYSSIGDFKDGLAHVSLKGLYGIINTNFQEITPLKYTSIWNFQGDLALVNVGGTIIKSAVHYGKYGFIDRTGKEVISTIYDDAEPFYRWFSKVKMDKKTYYIDKKEKLYTDFKPFKKQYYNVWDGKKYGIVDSLGLEIVPMVYDAIEESPEFFAKVKANGKFGFVDASGKVVIKIKYDKIEPIWYGSVSKKKYYKVSDGEKFGITDTLGVEIAAPVYDAIEKSPNFFASVKANGKYGFIDASGKVAIEVKYDEIGPFESGSAVVRFNGEYGLIDLSGKEVINPDKVKAFFKNNEITICDAIYANDFEKVKHYSKYVDLNMLYANNKVFGYKYYPIEILLNKFESAKYDKDYNLLHGKELFEIFHLFLDQGLDVDLDIGHKEGRNVDLSDRGGFRGLTTLCIVIRLEYTPEQIGDRLKLVQLLIEHKANVNTIVSNPYQSPLYSLVVNGRLSEDAAIAQLLIDHGADISIDGDKGQILIEGAKEKGATKELIEVLEKAKKAYKKK